MEGNGDQIKQSFQDEPITYDKVRWPIYRELIYRRKLSSFLPTQAKGVSKCVGVKTAKEFKFVKVEDSVLKLQYNDKFQDLVKFDGNFECANIEMVRQRDARCFDVWMRNDTNGEKELNWFFFRMRNEIKGTIKINIVNFTKSTGLWAEGMQPSFWSKQNFKNQEEGWHQDGSKIVYELSPYSKEVNEYNPMKLKNFMQLSFHYTFQELNDEVFCAYTVPYTYSAVLAHLKQLKLLSIGIAKFTHLGSSLGGIDIPLIKISNNFSSLKPIVLIVGRQHPGETHSSFIVHGFINHLLSTNPLAIKFRDYFETWIIPVVNPDGVICGNYRSNLQGKDMNRCFYQQDDPQAKSKCYEVELLTDKIKKTLVARKFRMFLDIHSHSSQDSIFIYAPQFELPHEQNYIQRLPTMLAQQSQFFSLDNCKFDNSVYKRNCARLAFHRDFDLLDTYTIEASAFGYYQKQKSNQKPKQFLTIQQFTPSDLMMFGKQLFECCARHLDCCYLQNEQLEVSGVEIPLTYGCNIEDRQRAKMCSNIKEMTFSQAAKQQVTRLAQSQLQPTSAKTEDLIKRKQVFSPISSAIKVSKISQRRSSNQTSRYDGPLQLPDINEKRKSIFKAQIKIKKKL